ncbi:MAG TPA: sigma-70 family RNA polymerase sigma factor [Thermoleophilaceae bacterium]|nr:sigma-70 family RNA polymerase sigma factor [Thermoleophilaceae bacterium]
MQHAIRHGGRADGRPTREEIEPAARALVERHSVQLLATARRYSLNADDADDAFQRGLEILLTKAPSAHEDDLVPWLKTVVKHEAFAIRKQRQRAEIVAEPDMRGTLAAAAHEHAERHERLRVSVEAMSRLKPQELRCLLLRADGYSYKQICDETGFSYTKVNRCVTEGRRAFLERVAGIESGAECDRLAPLLSRLVDGEASAEDMRALRPHLRSCLACRATLRDYREAPARVAALVPLLGAPHLLARGLRRLQDLLGFIGAHKTAAVVAATVAVAGGGVAAVHTIKQGHRPPPKPPAHHHTPKPKPAPHHPPAAHIAGKSATVVTHSKRRARRHTKHAVPRTPHVQTTLAAPSTTPPTAIRQPPTAAPPTPTQTKPPPPAGGAEFGP